MIQSFLISLETAQTRRATSVAALKAAEIPYTLIDAVDGRALPRCDVASFGRDIAGPEQACIASHITALQAFIDTDAPLGLVVEDDIAAVDSDTLSAVTDWLGQRSGWDVAHLVDDSFGFRSPWGQVGDVRIDRAHLFPMTTPALLWSREGARGFLGGHPAWPIDHALRQWTLGRRSGVGLSKAPVRLGDAPSLMTGRDALLTPEYIAKRDALRRRQKLRAAVNRLQWRMLGR